MSLEPCAAWIDADREPGKPFVREGQVQQQHDPRRHGGARGLEVSPRSFREDHLVQCQVGDGAPKPRFIMWAGEGGCYPASSLFVLTEPKILLDFRGEGSIAVVTAARAPYCHDSIEIRLAGMRGLGWCEGQIDWF